MVVRGLDGDARQDLLVRLNEVDVARNPEENEAVHASKLGEGGDRPLLRGIGLHQLAVADQHLVRVRIELQQDQLIETCDDARPVFGGMGHEGVECLVEARMEGEKDALREVAVTLLGAVNVNEEAVAVHDKVQVRVAG